MIQSRKIHFFIILLIIFGVPSSVISFDALSTSQAEVSWISFDLQQCGPAGISPYEQRGGENQDLVLDVTIANYSAYAQLTLRSESKVTDIQTNTQQVRISKTGLEGFSFLSNWFSLSIDTTLNKTIKHQIAVSGQYRLNGGEWQAFTLQRCFPNTLMLFEGQGYEYNLTLDLNIQNLTGNLEVLYSYSDTGESITLSNDSEQSYNILSHWVLLELYSEHHNQYGFKGLYYGYAEGAYKITTFDRTPVRGYLPEYPVLLELVIAFILLSLQILLPFLLLNFFRTHRNKVLK